MRYDLTTLKLLLAIVDEGSIAGAAEREHIVASAVSKRITELEQSLKTQLFVRNNKGIEPTQACLMLVRRANTIFRCLDELDREILDFSNGVRGHVRLVANLSATTQFLPQELQTFLERHPHVSLEIEEHVSTAITRRVTENVADVGIFTEAHNTSGLHIFPYRNDKLALIVPQAHPLAGRISVRFADTLDFPFVGLQKNSAMSSALLRASSSLNRTFKLRFHVSTFESVIAMVQAGLGIAVIPSGAVPANARVALSINVIPLEETWADRKLWICVRSTDSLSPAAKLLVDHLRCSAEEKSPTAQSR